MESPVSHLPDFSDAFCLEGYLSGISVAEVKIPIVHLFIFIFYF